MKVAVFGLGYVGTVTAACLAANGHDVWGVDPDVLKVAELSTGHSPVIEPGLEAVLAATISSGNLHATVSPVDALENADASLLLCRHAVYDEWRDQPHRRLPRTGRPHTFAQFLDAGECIPRRRDSQHGATRNGRGHDGHTGGGLPALGTGCRGRHVP